MGRTVVANFATRRDVELAVEHLTQQHRIERSNIFIRSPGQANTAGTKPAGADVESGHPGVTKDGDPELSGPVEVSVDCELDQSALVKSALEGAGGFKIRTD